MGAPTHHSFIDYNGDPGEVSEGFRIIYLFLGHITLIFPYLPEPPS